MLKNNKEFLNNIIEDITNSNVKLNDILLKVQILAFQLKNEKLKSWVNLEQNGYNDLLNKDLPKYRLISTWVNAFIIQSKGFGGYIERNNYPLPLESIDKEIGDRLSLAPLVNSVSQIEKMIENGNDYRIDVPIFLFEEFKNILANNCHIERAWQPIPISSLEGVLNSIRSNLLKFLLELNDKIGNDVKINISENNINKLFDKTIGSISITGKNVYINIDNSETQIKSNESNINLIKGNNNRQDI